MVINSILFSCSVKENKTESKSQEPMEFKSSIDKLAEVWYPRTIDSLNGGFYSNYDYKWEKEKYQTKMIVTQTRHIWTTSILAEYYQDDKYLDIATHGFHFLKDKMWDQTYGGFNTFAEVENGVFTPKSDYKTAYGNSFAIYGLATYYKLSKDTSALNLAKKTFLWLEEHSRDPEYGGYFNILQPDGSWSYLQPNGQGIPAYAASRWKDMNSSIHLLESFSALYEVWPDPLVKERLGELLTIISQTIFTEKGYMSLFLEKDWAPVSYKDSLTEVREQNIQFDHVSFGHDVETAFLMLEAAHVLGIDNSEILTQAKKIVDHSIDNGWDEKNGGFYDYGYYFTKDSCTIIRDDKVWWTQAEGLNSLLMMSKLFPNEKKYEQLFQKQWQYIDTYFVDKENGGWYADGADVKPDTKTARKASMWKINYHNIRSLINCQKMVDGNFALTASH